MTAGSISYTRGEDPLRADKLNASFSERLLVAGDTMAGPLILSRPPVLPFEAATKNYIDNLLTVKLLLTVGDIPPANVVPNTLWWHSTECQLYIYYDDGSSQQWVPASNLSALNAYAPLVSPVFTGDARAVTPAPGDNDTSIATTAFVQAAIVANGSVSPSNAIPAMDGTAAAGTSALYTRGDHIHPTDTSRAPLASPTFTGTLRAPIIAVTGSLTLAGTSVSTVDQLPVLATTSVAGLVKPDGSTITVDGTGKIVAVGGFTPAGTLGQLLSGTGSNVTVGTGLTLSSGTLTASGGGGGITDSPSDGSSYGRLNATWAKVAPLTGNTNAIFANAPGVTVKGNNSGATGPVVDMTSAQLQTMIGLSLYAPIANPTFTGDPKAPTPAAGDNDTSIATTAFVTTAVQPATNSVGRNLIHNPLFNIQQRGAGTFNATGLTADRWQMSFAGDTFTANIAAMSDSDRAGVGDEAASYSFNTGFTGAATAANYSQFAQLIEDVRRTAGKTITLSFYAAANTSLNVGLRISQYFGTGGSPSTAVSSTAQTRAIGAAWARYSATFTVPSITGKTVGTNRDSSLQVFFALSSGTTNAAALGVGAQTGFINFWGVQLEVGSAATPLEKPDPQQDLARCQRFYCSIPIQNGGYTGGTGPIAIFPYGPSAQYPTTMRAAPTLTLSGLSYNNCSALNPGTLGATGYCLGITVTNPGLFQCNATLNASADL